MLEMCKINANSIKLRRTMKKSKATGPQISEPTEKEINETIARVNKRYDIVIRHDDAVKLSKLYKELEWWFTVEKFSREPKSISIDTAKEIRSYFNIVKGKDLTLDEAHEQAKDSLAKTMLAEKERIASAIKLLVAKYQK